MLLEFASDIDGGCSVVLMLDAPDGAGSGVVATVPPEVTVVNVTTFKIKNTHLPSLCIACVVSGIVHFTSG